MKKSILLSVLAVLASVSLAYAHPPTDIQLSYDAPAKTLKAVIHHPVSNPATHYIKKADLGLNGKELHSRVFQRQENPKTQTVTFYVPEAKKGDKLYVEGYCSLWGKKKKEITVP